MKCLSCQTNNAIEDKTYGILPCLECQNKTHKTPSDIPEFCGDDIKTQRKQQADDIECHHRCGQLNKRWLQLYGKESAKRHGFSDKEIKEAKYVYDGDTSYYSHGDK
jgi:hypothetical protein